MSPGRASIWWEGYECTPPMVNQDQQDTYRATTALSAEAYLTDGYLDYRSPDAQYAHRGGEQPQSWQESPGSQSPGIYTQSSSDMTVYGQSKVAGLTDGSGYEERVRLPTLYGKP